MNKTILNDSSLDQLFRQARSYNRWQDREVSDEQIRQLYELTKWGPTAANSCPARLVFIKSDEAKQRLKPCLDEGNVEKSMRAPVVAIIGMDMEFYEQLPKLFPHTDARSWFAGKPEKIEQNALRNSSLQAAYLIMAARALGLDCGPMSGFNYPKLEAEFFPGGTVRANFICAIGYGSEEQLYPRGPRLGFDEACGIV
ncbi:MAG: malonic semialdehyde reductase [Chromatiales bacterium]|nr:malonic semialdehyde reductase [Gammaproteobacteria bacterium]MBW6477762.1 malonic semialdehyde reductase [Chromatiales bacterium]